MTRVLHSYVAPDGSHASLVEFDVAGAVDAGTLTTACRAIAESTGELAGVSCSGGTLFEYLGSTRILQCMRASTYEPEPREAATSGDRLVRFLSGASAADVGETWLRAELNSTCEALSTVLHDLSALTEQLEAECTKDHYSADPHVRGYYAGKARQAQAAQVAIAHVSNALILRATK